MKTTIPHLKNKQFGGAWSVHDPYTIHFRETIVKSNTMSEDVDKFLHDYRDWIGQPDLKLFPHMVFSQGTTETFDKFYLRHLNKRLRLHKGEYFYHQIMGRNYFEEFVWLDEGPIKTGDVVVMSCPFSDTGNLPEQFYEILQECDKQKVPVLLDMAYINISNIDYIDLRFDCIETVTTSLSKIFPVEFDRIGIRFEKTLYDDTLFAYNQNKYINLYSVNLGHEFIKRFDNNWIFDKYKDQQESMCDNLDLKLSRCVIFGIDYKNLYPEYNRGGSSNRLCFSRIWDNRVK